MHQCVHLVIFEGILIMGIIMNLREVQILIERLLPQTGSTISFTENIPIKTNTITKTCLDTVRWLWVLAHFDISFTYAKVIH